MLHPLRDTPVTAKICALERVNVTSLMLFMKMMRRRRKLKVIIMRIS
jgi:hypothetical protein